MYFVLALRLLLYKGPYAIFVKHDTESQEIFRHKKTPQVQKHTCGVLSHIIHLSYDQFPLKWKTNISAM